jgi:tryptophanyl-tRNA synthetase
MAEEKKIIFSGTQPSGKITLGNYLGALRNWVSLQDDYHAIYCVVDEHAITVRQDPAELRRQTLELFAQYLACGLDPNKTVIIIQSHVPQHAATGVGAHVYNHVRGALAHDPLRISPQPPDNINAGLFSQPTLMAAISCCIADLVPVGQDQKQHVELARDIAQRFNGIYGTVLHAEPYIRVGARIMS